MDCVTRQTNEDIWWGGSDTERVPVFIKHRVHVTDSVSFVYYLQTTLI